MQLALWTARLSEKRRKELALARLMAETIGVILYTGESDSDIRIEAAKDMVREFRHVYPEIAEILKQYPVVYRISTITRPGFSGCSTNS